MKFAIEIKTVTGWVRTGHNSNDKMEIEWAAKRIEEVRYQLYRENVLCRIVEITEPNGS